MARLDMTGLVDLWNRIGDVFARRLEAAGSMALSGTSIVMSSLTGSQLASVDLGNTFATDGEAAHSLTASNFALTLSSVTGAVLTNALDLTAQAKAALNGYFARGLTWNGSTGNLTLNAGDGTSLDTVNISIPSLTGYATQDYVLNNAICSAGITFEPSTNLIKITFYNGKGVEVDSVAWTS